jgi:oxygen-independent coproporphyrinogen-3 oxidase
VGVASFGHLNGVHYQNHHDFGPYVERVQRGELPIHRALTPTADERFIREFILQLKLGQVSRAAFRRKFGTDPAVRFAGPLQRLGDRGFLSADGDSDVLRVNREGLLQIDKLLHEFFLPEHRGERYA